MKEKKLVIGFAVVFFVIMSTVILASATVYPVYNTEQDCRGCHGSDVSDRHHLLVANGTYQCTDCHPVQYDNVTQQYSPQIIRNCLICHPGKDHTDVHHILASKGLFVCSDCHPLIYDNVTQTYAPRITWDCTFCHSTVLSIQNVTPTPTPDPTPAPIPPEITNLTPISPVTNFVGDSRSFHITIDQISDVTWSINGTPVQSDTSVTDAVYTNTNAPLGIWNVSVTASNTNGNVTYMWEWIVTTPPPPIEAPSINSNFPLYPSVNDSVGSSRKFGISIDQNVDVQWLINGDQVQFNENTNGSNYTNTSAELGIWNVDAIVNNTNGTDTYRWIWNVTQIQSSQPVITGYNPTLFPNDTAGSSRVFNITINQPANVTWYINGTQVSSDTNVVYADYTNISAEVGIWNVSAIVSNPNGSTMNSWTWNVSPIYSPPGIVDYSPSSTINDTEGSSRMFNITTNQTVNITWYINGDSVWFEPGVISSSYTNISAFPGIWNVKAIATNSNGNITQSWIWNVASNPKPNTAIEGTNGKNGWYVASTIYLNATDNDGIKYTNYSVDGGDWINSIYSRTSVNLSDGNHSIRYYSVDNLNGIEPTKTQLVKVDETPPMVTINSPINGSVYILNQKVFENWSVIDATSGISSVATSSGVISTTSSTTRVISTTSIGTKSFGISAIDNAGNTNTTNVIYYVRYNFGGFLSPIANDGSSIFRPGSKINIRFKLSDANLKNVATATAKLNFSLISPIITGKILQPFSSDTAQVDGVFKYDSKNMWYYYNLDSKGLTNGTWQIRADINDGSSYVVNISIQK